MGSYKGNLQCHFETPFTLTDTTTFRNEPNFATLFWKILVQVRTLSDFEIFFEDNLESKQTSNKLTSKTGTMFLGRSKIYKN